MMTVIGSLKGGSGKSTVTFNMAVWLSLAGRQVLALDADPQATLTDVCEVRREEGFEPLIAPGSLDLLDDRDALDRHEDVLVDIGTASMDHMRQALSLCDRVVIPVPPSQADIWSTQRFIRYVQSVRGEALPEMLAFINRADTNRAIRESDEAAAALVSLPVVRYLKPRLSQRTVFRRSFSEGLAVFEMEPRGKGAREWNALTAQLFPSVLG